MELEQANRALQAEIVERKSAEEAVKRERQRLYDVLETLPVYVVLLSADYHVPFANHFFRQRFGESEGRRCYEYLFHRDAPCEICETYTVLKTAAPHRWEWIGPDGRNYDIFDFPFTDEGGAPLVLEMGIDITERKRAEEALQTVHNELEQRVVERTEELTRVNEELRTDITERRRAEDALRESEESLREAQRVGHLGSWNLNVLTGDLQWSDECYCIYGFRPQEFVPTYERFRSIVHPEDLGFVQEQVDAALNNDKHYDVDFRFVRPNGEIGSIHCDGEVVRDAEGKPLRFFGTQIDITERKRAEEASRESEERHRTILRTAMEGFWRLDLQGRLLEVNEAYCRMSGYSEQELLAMSIPELEAAETPNDTAAHLKRIEARGEDRFESRHRHKDGSCFMVEISVQYQPAEGGRLVVFLRNITERKLAQEAERDQRQLAEALCETAAALNRSLDLDHVLDTILENAGRVVPYDAGEVLLLTSGARVQDVRHKGYEERGLEEWAKNRDFPLSDFPILARVVETRQPLVVPDTRDFPGWVDLPEGRWIRSHVCAPIIGKDLMTGFICLSNIRPNMYGLEHARRLGAFADQAAVALENASLFAQVRTGSEQLGLLSRRLLEAQEVERRRVARELHDEVGQLLTGLKLVLQMTAAGAPQGQKPGLDEAETLVSELMTRVRQLSLDLRPAMLDDLGLLPALLWHLPRYTQQTHVAVDFKHAGIEGRRFSPELETAAYRIVQEALTNVARHGGVTQATVRIWGDTEALTVQVEDRGAGFDPEALSASGKTSGLAGIHERVALLGGQLTLEAAPGQGAHLTAVLPLAESTRSGPPGDKVKP